MQIDFKVNEHHLVRSCVSTTETFIICFYLMLLLLLNLIVNIFGGLSLAYIPIANVAQVFFCSFKSHQQYIIINKLNRQKNHYSKTEINRIQQYIYIEVLLRHVECNILVSQKNMLNFLFLVIIFLCFSNNVFKKLTQFIFR